MVVLGGTLLILGLHFVRHIASCVLAETPTQFIHICGPQNTCSVELDVDFLLYLDRHCTTCTDKCKSLLTRRTCQKQTAALNTALAICGMPPAPDCSPDHAGAIHLKDCASGALHRTGVSPLTVTSTTAANFYFCITKPLLVPECTLQVTIGSQTFTPGTTFCAPSSPNMQASHNMDTMDNNMNMDHNNMNMDNSNTVKDSNQQLDMHMNNNGNGGTDGGMSNHMGINRNPEELLLMNKHPVQSKLHTTQSADSSTHMNHMTMGNTGDTNSTPMKMDMSTQQQTANSNTNSIQLEISTSCGLTYFVSQGEAGQSGHTSQSSAHSEHEGHIVTGGGGMDMWFHSNINGTVLWQWWRPQTSPTFVLSNIAMFIFALSLHFIAYSMKICTTRRNKTLAAGVLAISQSQQHPQFESHSPTSSVMQTPNSSHPLETTADRATADEEFTTCSSTSIIYFLLQGLGFSLHYTFGMFIMLIVMTMNVWYFVSIVIGNTIGYGMTAWMSENQSRKNNQFGGDQPQSPAAHC